MRSVLRTFVLLSICSIALVPSPAQWTAQKNQGDSLLVYGSGFSFSVKEPLGWDSDTGDLARRYGVSVVFSPQQKASREYDVTIRIQANRKADESTEKDLNADMDGYKKEYPSVRFEELPVAHAKYKTFAKLFFIPDKFYEYVVYVNPGKDVPMVFSFAFSKRSKRASAEELAAFTQVIRSFTFLTPNVIEK